ncbi:MAG: D-glycero-beta-D-manno-heptose-7-phosphate kinase [Candidatus Omnitrophica bacterium CG07_land_8_20_14_0_80_42_15]|uniref:D-glycero-beta-D-manno-heptose-7-phosphate kinase n=1 Tax=Candidatus Aquitaenariimonas noxiae TaxID=1974741 RepID=A0A2J0L654_9BACT|nr:MAG: D-glycero-beta-D-manno-heptose-7-phosphate kinase [Candidatus Omnitrophica bacterium CG07_land_8_20_14_0_80_42_15]
MKTLGFEKLKEIINKFKKAKVLVVGDLMLDEYVWGDVTRISPEAPVPIVKVNKENFMPGGASNVANNIVTLGGKAILVGVIGSDGRGEILKKTLKDKGVDIGGVISDISRPTTLKTRVIASHQQVVRIDKEKTDPLSSKVLSKVIDYVRRKLEDVDSLIIEDYGKGVIIPQLLDKVVSMARAKNKLIIVDPKEENFSFYKGITGITPNQHEASCAVGFAIKDEETLNKAGFKLLNKLGCKVVVITLGERGMRVFERRKRSVHIPTVAQEVFDVSGAGDTVIGTFTLSLSCGAEPIVAAHIANCAAGIVIGKLGTAVVTKDELIERIKKEMER